MTTWRRPRGHRKIPPARLRAPADPYGALHRKIRAVLMARLAATGPWPCPICDGPMVASMGRMLHLHHSNPDAKLAGLPGDQLAHARCNIRDGARLGAAITNNRTVSSSPAAQQAAQSGRRW
jgi:hypothetical protein